MAKRRRKKKINVKLLLIVAGVVVVLGGGFAALKLKGMLAGDPDRMYRLAQKNRQEGNYEEAMKYYVGLTRSKRLDPARKTEIMMESVEFLDQWMEERRAQLTPERRREIWATRKEQLRGVLRADPTHEEARRLFSQAWWDDIRSTQDIRALEAYLDETAGHVEYLPNDAEIYFRRAQVFSRLIGTQEGMYEQARQSLETAIEKDPSNIDYYEQLGTLIYSREGAAAADQVEQLYQAGLEANPDSARLMAGYALFLRTEGRSEEAEQWLAAAEAEEDKSLFGHLGLATYYLRLAGESDDQQALDRAVAHLEQARQMDPLELQTYVLSARALTLKNEHARAIEVLGQGLDAYEQLRAGRQLNDMSPEDLRLYGPGAAELNMRLAELLLNYHSRLDMETDQAVARARQHIEALREIMPEIPSADGLAGWAALIEGDMREAERLLRTAYEDSGRRDLRAGELLVNVYTSERMKNLDEAMTIVNNLLAINDDMGLQLRKVNILIESARFNEAWQLISNLQSRDMPPAQQEQLNRYATLTATQVENATIQYDALPEQISEDEIPVWLGRAAMLSRGDQQDQALEVYEAILAQYPAQLNALQSVLLMYGDQGRQQEGEQLLAAALQASPDLADEIEQVRPYLYAENREQRARVSIDLVNSREDSVEKFLQLARLYNFAGDPQGRRESLESALAMDSSNADVVNQLFNACIEAEDFDRAAEMVELAEQHNLDEMNGDLFRARLLIAQGEMEQAIPVCEAILRQRPYFSQVHSLLGEAYIRLGEYEQAEQAFSTAYRQNGANITARLGMARVADRLGRPEEALAIVREVARLMPNHPYVQQRLLIDQSRENPAQAIEVRERIYEADLAEMANGGRINQQNADQLIALYLDPRTRNLEKAEEVLRQMYGITRGHPEGLRYLGQLSEILRQLDRPGLANELLADARENNPDRVGALAISGQFFSAMDQPTQARRMFEAAIEADPNDPRGYDSLSRWAEVNREWDLALEQARRTIELEPDTDRFKQRLVVLLLSAGRPEEALAKAREYQQQEPDQAEWRLLEGIVHEQSIRLNQALESYRRAEQLEPELAQAKMLIAQALIRTGDFAQARQKANEAWRLQPSVEVASIRVSAAQSANDAAAARTYMQEALNEFPSSVALYRQAVGLYTNQEAWRALEGVLEQGKQLEPNNAYWWVAEAQMAESLRDLDRERRALEQATQITSSPAILERYLDALVRAGDTERVMELTSALLDNSQMAWMAHAFRGRALAADQDRQAAEAEFLAAFEVEGTPSPGGVLMQMRQAFDPRQANSMVEQWAVQRDSWQLWYAAAQIYVGQGDNVQARQALQNALDRVTEPSLALPIHRQLGLVCNFLQDFEQAEAHYRAALAIREEPETMNNLAFLLANDMQRPEDALPLAERAAQMLSTQPSVIDTLGWIYYRLGRYEDAQRELLRSIGLQSTAASYYHLGRVYEAMDRDQDAEEMYSRGWALVRADPNNEFFDLIDERLQAMRTGR